MKTCDEMMTSLLERRERHAAEQKKKRKMQIRTALPLCGVCLLVLVGLGIGLWQGDVFGTASPDENLIAGGTTSGGIFCGNYWVPDGTANTPSAPSAESSAPDSATSESPDENDVCELLVAVVVDGVTYVQSEVSGAYTLGECLGAGESLGMTGPSKLTDFASKVYVSKESSDVLIARFGNGEEVLLHRVLG